AGAAHRGHEVPDVDLLAAFLVEPAGQLGAHVAGGDGVHAHAAAGPFERGGAGEVVDGGLRGVVGGLRLGDVGDDAAHRAGVDDAAAAPLEHAPTHGGEHVVDAVEVQGHHGAPLLAVPVLDGVVDGAPGVVQQDLDPTHLRIERGDDLLDLGLVSDVEVAVGDGDAGLGGEVLRGLLAGRIVDVREDDRGAVLGEALGHREAQALRAAGDEGGAAGEVEPGADRGGPAAVA